MDLTSNSIVSIIHSYIYESKKELYLEIEYKPKKKTKTEELIKCLICLEIIYKSYEFEIYLLMNII